MTEPAAEFADAHAAGVAALTGQLGMAEPTARHVAAVVLAAAVPALPATARSVLTLTSEAAGMHLGVAISRAVGPAIDAALTEERSIVGPQMQTLTWEREQLATRVAELDAAPTAKARAGMVVAGGERWDVYRSMRDAGRGHVRAVQETIYQAFLTLHDDPDTVRDGWQIAACLLCDWRTTGSESVAEDAAYEHAALHVDQLENAGWVVASAVLPPPTAEPLEPDAPTPTPGAPEPAPPAEDVVTDVDG